MMKAAKKGACEAGNKYNLKEPTILAVTVLTSISEETLKNSIKEHLETHKKEESRQNSGFLCRAKP